MEDISEVVHLIRDFVRQKRLNRERVTATEVLHFLHENNLISVKTHSSGDFDERDYANALRAVQRLLRRNGFQRGPKTGAVRINPNHVAARNRYLRILLENRALPPNLRLTEVYSDESYLHHHHRLDYHTLYHPLDKNYTEAKPPRKGKRVCFVAAIRGGGRSHNASLVPGSFWMFTPTNASHHKGDYHRVFNSVNYVEWFRTCLLPNLESPSLIIIDNASYHKRKPADTPVVHRMKKAQVLAALDEVGISYHEKITAVEAKQMLKKWQDENIEMEIVQLAQAEGHSVLFTPPCYSDLQPIELVWASVKGRVAREYKKGVTFREVRDNLAKQFEYLLSEAGSESIGNIIDSVDRVISKFLSEIAAELQTNKRTSSVTFLNMNGI